MVFTELVENVKKWSEAKGLDKANPIKQMQKLNEEWGELNAGKAKGDPEKIVDSIGDVLVVLIILSQQLQLDKIEHTVDPTKHNFQLCASGEVETDILLLFGGKEIGSMADLLFRWFVKHSDTKVQIQFHIRNLSGILYHVAINEGISLEDCLSVAWHEIKDRQGKMVEGVFVKDEDLK